MIMLAAVIVPAIFGVALRLLKPGDKRLRYALLLIGQAGGFAAVLAVIFGAGAPFTLFKLPGGLSFMLAADGMGRFFACLGSAVSLPRKSS